MYVGVQGEGSFSYLYIPPPPEQQLFLVKSKFTYSLLLSSICLNQNDHSDWWLTQGWDLLSFQLAIEYGAATWSEACILHIELFEITHVFKVKHWCMLTPWSVCHWSITWFTSLFSPLHCPLSFYLELWQVSIDLLGICWVPSWWISSDSNIGAG